MIRTKRGLEEKSEERELLNSDVIGMFCKDMRRKGGAIKSINIKSC